MLFKRKKSLIVPILCLFLLPLGGCGHAHTIVVDEGKEATCTEDGLSEGSHCSECGEVMQAQEVIPAKGHTAVIDEAKEATCTEAGLTEGSHCSVCGEVLQTQEVIPAKGHTIVIDEGRDATCTEDGLTEGSHCSECGEVLQAQEVIPAKGHTIVIDEGRDATCTEAGLTEGSHCSVCGEVLRAQEVIPAKGHTVVTDGIIWPTCIQTGLTEGSHCSVCGEVIVAQQTMEKIPHEKQLMNYGTKNEYILCPRCRAISLPAIYIDSNSNIVKDSYAACKVSVRTNNENYDFESAEAKIKIRGNYTSNLDKKPYRIKFGEKTNMLGLNSGSKCKSWVLLAEHKDRSHFKNMSAFYMAKRILENNYSSDYKFVDVYLNNVYNGIYLLAEQQEVGKNRINIAKCQDNYQGTDIGYLLELDSFYYTEDNYFSIDYNDLTLRDEGKLTSNNFCHEYVIKNDIYSNEQKTFIQGVLQNIWNILYDTLYNNHSDLDANPYKTLDENYLLIDDATIKSEKEAIEKVVDLDSFLQMFLLNEIVQNNDVGWSSFYLSFDASETGNKKLRMVAPWDFDNAYDCSTSGLYTFTKKNRDWAGTHLVSPWFSVFAKSDWFLEEAAKLWKNKDCKGIVSGLISDLETKCSLFANPFNLNDQKWFGENYSTVYISELKEYLKKRADFLETYFSNL